MAGTNEQQGAPQPNHKEEPALVELQDVGTVTVLTVGNANIYPLQANEIATKIKAAILNTQPPRILVDMSPVEFMCSAMLGKLIQASKLAKERSGELKLCAQTERVLYSMNLVKLGDVLHVANDRQELLDAFGTAP